MLWRRFFLIGLALLLAACAQPARVGQMIHHPTKTQVASVPDNMKGGIELVDVIGGQGTDPLWMSEVGNLEFREALRSSLDVYGLIGYGDDVPLALTAHLIELEQPLAGFDVEVTSTVQYVVTRRSDGVVVLDETIVTPYTEDFSSTFLAVERLRLANEGAIRRNIETFITTLIEKSSGF